MVGLDDLRGLFQPMILCTVMRAPGLEFFCLFGLGFGFFLFVCLFS